MLPQAVTLQYSPVPSGCRLPGNSVLPSHNRAASEFGSRGRPSSAWPISAKKSIGAVTVIVTVPGSDSCVKPQFDCRQPGVKQQCRE
jgi:hypothetical protein